MSKKNTYWLEDAMVFSILPILIPYTFLFVPIQSQPDRPLFCPEKTEFKIPYYAAAVAIMLMSLPVSALTALITLPIAAVHDVLELVHCSSDDGENRASSTPLQA